MSWYALKHESGKYLGQHVDWVNGVAKRWQTGLVDLQRASMSYGIENARVDARRGEQILGMQFEPVEIRIDGRGRDARVKLAGPAPGKILPPVKIS